MLTGADYFVSEKNSYFSCSKTPKLEYNSRVGGGGHPLLRS